MDNAVVTEAESSAEGAEEGVDRAAAGPKRRAGKAVAKKSKAPAGASASDEATAPDPGAAPDEPAVPAEEE